MKHTWLSLLILFTHLFVFPQSNGFYSEFKDPEGKTWRVGDVIETEKGVVLSLRDWHSPIMESKVVRLSSEGEIINELFLSAVDTSINLCYLFPPSHGMDCIVGLGICTPPDGNAGLLTLRVDDELNEISRSLSPLPASDNDGYYLDSYGFLQFDEGYFACLTYQGLPYEKEIKLCKISNEGEVLQVERMEDTLVGYVANMFHVHDCPSGLGLFITKWRIEPDSHVNTCVIVYDGNLRLERICDIQNLYEDDGHGHINAWDIELYNSLLKPSPDRGYIISSRLFEYDEQTHDRSALLANLDSSFTTQPQYCVIGHFNDTVEAPAFYRSLDVNGEGLVYQCSMQNVQYSSWPYGSNGTHLIVTKADTDLNILWQKRLLKNGHIYSAFQTLATADGGYLMIGNVYDHNPDGRLDLFILKLNAEGTVGLDEIREENMAFVYPNPAKETIRIGGVEAEETNVYNPQGQCVMSFRGNEAIVRDLVSGVYLLIVTDKEKVKHTLRLIVNNKYYK